MVNPVPASPPGRHTGPVGNDRSGAERQPSPPHVSTVDDDLTLVRPYLVAGGRTRPVRDGLQIQTLVRALPAAMYAPIRFEQRRIVELCQAPLSIAELASALQTPLGVVRVLIADLIAAELVVISSSTDATVETIERIIERVRLL